MSNEDFEEITQPSMRNPLLELGAAGSARAEQTEKHAKYARVYSRRAYVLVRRIQTLFVISLLVNLGVIAWMGWVLSK